MRELIRVAPLVEVFLLLSKLESHVLFEYNCLGTICNHSSSQGFGKLCCKFIWLQYCLCQSTQPLLCPALPLVLLESCFLCDEELQRAEGFLAVAAARDAPAVQEKPGLWEPWQWLCLGAWVAKGDMACGVGESRGTKGFMEPGFLDGCAQWWIYMDFLLPQKGEQAEKQGWGGKDQHWLSWQLC